MRGSLYEPVAVPTFCSSLLLCSAASSWVSLHSRRRRGQVRLEAGPYSPSGSGCTVMRPPLYAPGPSPACRDQTFSSVQHSG